MAILVCGGAGYIGSHAVHELINNGEKVIVVDNLSTGHREAVHSNAIFYEIDLRDANALSEVFNANQIRTVMHFAASSLVGESMENPLAYYDNNVHAVIILLKIMNEYGVSEFIFSSTAATYGNVNTTLITEETPTNPTNPYGDSKLAIEKLLYWNSMASNFKYKIFRYFNVAGASTTEDIGEDHNPETHLIPIILEVARGKREELTVFGDDYNTPDGTCIRDYIHVTDLVGAHILGISHLRKTGRSDIYNLGNGEGFSVLQIIKTVEDVTGMKIPYSIGERRAGDPDRLIASSQKAKLELSWEPKHEAIEEIIRSAWTWHSKHPNGYGK